ncbi:MAG: SDR family oxidoreductase [Deltaproteobacteria bacterium]|nr:SDR family oxidoreductase [Deltaproteobacteria bacterium]
MKRVVIITGAAGGIGRASAKIFATAGWQVVGIDKNKKVDLPEVAHFIQADISQPDTPKQILDEISAQEGRLDALINNAAIQVCKPLIETTLSEWDLTMASNVRSAYLLTLAAYPLLKKNGGAIVNVCSVHAVATSPGMAAYASSKGALLALTRSMALELAPDKIRVNAILPGAVDTEMLRAGLCRDHVQGDTAEGLIRSLGATQIMGRVGRPEEIGRAILFLADTEQSSFMTGQSLIVDGGATARLSTE